jgi:hypothetical protein
MDRSDRHLLINTRPLSENSRLRYTKLSDLQPRSFVRGEGLAGKKTPSSRPAAFGVSRPGVFLSPRTQGECYSPI